MWRQRLGDVRMEANGNAGSSRSFSDSTRREFGGGGSFDPRLLQDRSTSRENTLTLNLKGTQLLGARRTCRAAKARWWPAPRSKASTAKKTASTC